MVVASVVDPGAVVVSSVAGAVLSVVAGASTSGFGAPRVNSRRFTAPELMVQLMVEPLVSVDYGTITRPQAPKTLVGGEIAIRPDSRSLAATA